MPRERIAEFGDRRFTEFEMDKAVGLVRVCTLVCAGSG
jgi:hypothetical protein